MTELTALKQLAAETSAEKLEAGVPEGLQLLYDIKLALTGARENPEVANWLSNLESIEAGVERKRTVVGVMGSTGSGKSSVINALLDEESLLPTNCMRACTAVITEIAFNESEAPEEKYRGEVEFISKEEWEKELLILWSDLFDPQGNQLMSEHTNEDSEAGIAYAKIRAVYPHLTKNDLIDNKLTRAELAQSPSVVNILGKTTTISAATSDEFASSLQKFIDSKEKSRGRKPHNELDLELWPLIKVVKLYIKHPILKTGMVIVDLPGVHDSNAARAAIAAKYQENCTGIWIVAPITRAVDDKSAQELLGAGFRRQVQYDGAFSNISIICSKTDQLTVTEALKNLPQVDNLQARELTDQIEQLKADAECKKTEAEALKQRIAQLGEEIEQRDKEIDSLEHGVDHADGDQVSFSVTQGRKRKLRAAALASRKRVQAALEENEDSDSDSSGVEDVDLSNCEEQEPLTISLEQAKEKLLLLKAEKKQAKDDRHQLELESKPLRKEAKGLKAKARDMERQRRRMCIQWRNEYSRPAIQLQFAAGVREMDQEDSRDDEEAYDPSEEVRDYEKVASGLPVFCVSSHAYLKIIGKLEKDDPVPGFQFIEDTEIPQLQKHAEDLTKSARVVSCRKFFTDILKLLHSLMIQLVMSEAPFQMLEELKRAEQAFLERTLGELKNDLLAATEDALEAFGKVLDRNIFRKVDAAIQLAAHDVPHITEQWGMKKDDGGLAFQTYRATCVRDGRFKGSKGPKDFNEELADLLKKKLARRWERTFTTDLPSRIDSYGQTVASLVNNFHKRMEKREELVKQPSFAIIAQQNEGICHTARDTTLLKCVISCGQRDANREITPAIAEKMAPCYAQCGSESGPGAFRRIKDGMVAHINLVRKPMYRAATNKVEAKLYEMMGTLQGHMACDTGRIAEDVHKDYSALIADHNIFKVLTAAKTAVLDLLSGADKRFSRLRVDAPVTIATPADDDTCDTAMPPNTPDRKSVLAHPTTPPDTPGQVKMQDAV